MARLEQSVRQQDFVQLQYDGNSSRHGEQTSDRPEPLEIPVTSPIFDLLYGDTTAPTIATSWTIDLLKGRYPMITDEQGTIRKATSISEFEAYVLRFVKEEKEKIRAKKARK